MDRGLIKAQLLPIYYWSGLVLVGISVDIYAMVGVVVIVKVSVVGQKSVGGQTKDVVPSDALDQIEFI